MMDTFDEDHLRDGLLGSPHANAGGQAEGEAEQGQEQLEGDGKGT